MRSFEPPSNQMALPGLDPVGEERMRDARRWVATHRHEFEWYKAQARRECANAHDRKASPNRCLYGMRITFSFPTIWRRTSLASRWRKTLRFACGWRGATPTSTPRR